MMIGAISNSYNAYTPYTDSYGSASANKQPSTMAENAASAGIAGTSSDTGEEGRVIVRNPGESTEKQAGKKSSPAECETCKNRKYQDGSDEDVSFKSPAHINPNAAASRVRSHEQEHVNNAYKKAAENNGKVMSCNVSIHTDICPECGRTYVSGGTTATQIKYMNEENPYQKEMKSSDAANKYRGMHLDIAC
jgi:hypothetical protein